MTNMTFARDAKGRHIYPHHDEMARQQEVNRQIAEDARRPLRSPPPEAIDDPRIARMVGRYRDIEQQRRSCWLVMDDLNQEIQRQRPVRQRLQEDLDGETSRRRVYRADDPEVYVSPGAVARIEREIQRCDAHTQDLQRRHGEAKARWQTIAQLAERCRSHLLEIGVREDRLPSTVVGRPISEATSVVGRI